MAAVPERDVRSRQIAVYACDGRKAGLLRGRVSGFPIVRIAAYKFSRAPDIARPRIEEMMQPLKSILMSAALLLSAASAAHAQQTAPAAPAAAAARTCINQYADAQGITPAHLVNTGFEIKAAFPGGLWLSKGKETYYCNSGNPPDSAVICWSLREPVKGGPCQ
jgi:hypothetical protein